MGSVTRHKKRRFSLFSLIRNGVVRSSWGPMWRDPELKRSYDIVIIGGGGHGLATAYYLARNHGITNIAVLEKSWLGGGNTARNTAVIRSNYLYPESARFFDFSLKLYERLTSELNYNIMLSQRGMLTLAHGRHDLQFYARWASAMALNGIDVELLSPQRIKQLVPLLNFSPTARFPIQGGMLQRRAGTARHDAVAWGYARAADTAGVDIKQQCEVTAIRPKISGEIELETTRGTVIAGKVGIATAGSSSILAAMAGFQVPLESFALQAFVSEPLKPILDMVVISPTVHVYVNQSDKGELVVGGRADEYISYGQRGSYPALEFTVRSLVEMFPSFSRLRMLRQWSGAVDLSPDRSPIISDTPVRNLYISGGWGTGGFKAIPAGGWTFAHLLATGRQHELAAPFDLNRFRRGKLIDEGAASGVAH